MEEEIKTNKTETLQLFECGHCGFKIRSKKVHTTCPDCGKSEKVVIELSEEEVAKQRSKVRDAYYRIKDFIGLYMDIPEDHKVVASLWIIGTYFHDNMPTFPLLHLNAMKGSGKSRLLEILCDLSKDGKYTKAPTEANLFRTKGMLGIDEFERVANKEKAGIREFLNASYKKGITISRQKKKKTSEGEEYVTEEFECYRPVAYANIWGSEEVLSDRSITLILQKSDNPRSTRLIYRLPQEMKGIRENLIKCSLCSVDVVFKYIEGWNDYTIHRTTQTTLTTPNYTKNDDEKLLLKDIHYTLTTLNYTNYTNNEFEEVKRCLDRDSLFCKIYDSDILGRDLELYLPLIFIADMINFEVVEQIIQIAKKITKEKAEEDNAESIDITLIDFISRQQPQMFHKISILFKEFSMNLDYNPDWLNPKWFGQALRRMELASNKRRLGTGIEVMLDIGKAKDLLKKLNRRAENESDSA